MCLNIAVFLSSILVTLVFWSILPDSFRTNENADYKSFYEPVARNILEGRGLMTMDGTPATRCPPGYPILIAGILGLSARFNIPERIIFSAFILFCTGLTSLFVFLIATVVWESLPALVSALVWMTYPLALYLTKQPNSEILFMVVFYASFYLFWRLLIRKSRLWPAYFFTGLLVGFAMLIRPIAIGLGFIMGLIIWFAENGMSARTRIFLIIMILLGNIVAIFPWEGWVYLRTGRIVTLSTAGAMSIRDGLIFAVNPKSWRQGLKVTKDVETLMRGFLARSNEMKSFGGIISILKEKCKAAPVTVAKLYAIKAARSLYGTDSQRFESLILLIQVVYFFLIILGCRFSWKWGCINKHLIISIWLVAFYFWMMTIVALSIVRYMTPVLGLLFVFIPGFIVKSSNPGSDAIAKKKKD